MDTEGLIRSLAGEVDPVKPLRAPVLRMAGWTAITATYLLVLVAIMSPRQDLGARMQNTQFLIEQAAAVLTGLTAAAAAFATVVPGHRFSMLLWPLLPLSVWVGTVAVRAQQEYTLVGGGILAGQVDWGCVGTILLGTVVPAVAMGTMLRRGAPLTPRLSAALGGLAAAAMGNLGVSLFHPHDSNLILLFWHCGTVLVFAAIAGIAGAQLLRWPPPRAVAILR